MKPVRGSIGDDGKNRWPDWAMGDDYGLVSKEQLLEKIAAAISELFQEADGE